MTDLITSTDISRLLDQYNIPSSPSLISQILAELDLNHDGKVTVEEFNTYCADKDKKLQTIFQEIDSNKDLHLSKDEIKLALQKLGAASTDDQIDFLINFLDTSKDKKISFSEFRNFVFLLPVQNIMSVFDHWSKASMVDLGLGESCCLPDEIKTSKKGETIAIFVAGGVAGAISRTATAPLDRLKVILQAGGGEGGGVWQGLVGIYKEGGWRAFFKGNGTNVIKIIPETASKFLLYDKIKELICRNPKSPSAGEKFISGGLAGALSQALIYPLEITKTRLALAPKGHYDGILDCVRSIVKKEGGKQLYKGLGASLMGIIPYAAIDLTIFNTLRDLYSAKKAEKPNALVLLSCGATSSICGQVVSYPLALMRTKLQSQGLPGREGEKEGLGVMVRKIWKKNGWKGFYMGIIPNFMKSVPAISISYAIFERVKDGVMQKMN